MNIPKLQLIQMLCSINTGADITSTRFDVQFTNGDIVVKSEINSIPYTFSWDTSSVLNLLDISDSELVKQEIAEAVVSSRTEILNMLFDVPQDEIDSNLNNPEIRPVYDVALAYLNTGTTSRDSILQSINAYSIH